MTKSPDAFRTISEVATWLGVQAHVLRFWESKFTQVKPVKRAGGRRYYRPSDMRLIGGIKTLLHDDGMTIKGVQKILREQGAAHVAALSPPLDGEEIETASAIEVEEPRGTVLAFKAKPGSPAAARPASAAPAAQDADSGPAPQAADAQQPGLPFDDSPAETAPAAAAHEPEAPETQQTAAEATAPEAAEERAAETGGEAVAESPPLPSELPTEPGLPSFLSPSAPPSPLAEGAPEPRPQVTEASVTPLVTELPYTPGALGHLAGMTAMSRDQAARVAPIARALRDWYDRQTKAGNG